MLKRFLEKARKAEMSAQLSEATKHIKHNGRGKKMFIQRHSILRKKPIFRVLYFKWLHYYWGDNILTALKSIVVETVALLLS